MTVELLDIEARSLRAVAAAVSAARALGLEVSEPKVLHDVFSNVVHVGPSPVVVRVPAVLPIGLTGKAQHARQARELAAVSWLAEQGVPVVRPSPLVPTEPVSRDGFSMTFWELVDVVPQGDGDMLANTQLLPQLHAALRNYSAELPFLSPVAITVPSCIAWLEQHPGVPASLTAADVARARREWQALAPLLTSQRAFEAAFPRATLQAVHGDAPFYNIIHTPEGHLYADFEDVCLGPPEWDLAGVGPEYKEAYDAASEHPLDDEVLRLMSVARNMQMIACLALVPQLPVLEAGLAPLVEAWRDAPFAGGFS